MEKKLVFKWTVSRGRDTYGYNICSLWVDNHKVASCNGGGYDMQGTVLADFMSSNFLDELKALPSNYGSSDSTKGFYGLSFRDANFKAYNHYKDGLNIGLDGACGFSSMERILNAIGYKLKFVHESKNETIYLLINKTLTETEKGNLYRAGKYRFTAPPVSTGNWDESSWIKYIDAHGKWEA